ncbi:L-carnitine dehydratase/bile acid-inducible protein F [Rhodopseudomonas palustris HaA2]|uniref:L-carnitine dehydratase/bile acid-inducible protein F n=1 Tax=Rhodopseudomonas palustris (strain HaA2) TaxID=316058 RepID=Q2IWD4_RHOP2|nr:CoA transferase [Rhodopseudomonas palustris]ABD07476.1 L-carnitine dehydratase/bile acid-inducible protein F [Rhodopseudomonas palustris HaA2]
MGGPLAGLKVIEIAQAIAGPMAGMILGDMGADVIKIEKHDGGDDARHWGPPFIDGDSLLFHTFNRNKRSVTLDIKNPDDVAKLKDLVKDADILIQNLRSGVVADCGIGPDVMCAINPRLIYCSVWAFGKTGPLSREPGFDPLLQAYGGVMSLTGSEGDPPTFCAPAINDRATAQWCVIGALAALQQRHVTGKGGVVDTSLFDTAVAWVDIQLNNFLLDGEAPTRHGTASATLAPYQVFETADRPIVIAAGNDRLFAKCAEVLGHPEWITDERFARVQDRSAHRVELIALMQPVLTTRSAAEWLSALKRAGVPVSPVNDIPELAATEQLASADMLRTMPGSRLKVAGLPIMFDGERPHPVQNTPKLGAHNAEVLVDRADAAE